jgi:hypothetical protein
MIRWMSLAVLLGLAGPAPAQECPGGTTEVGRQQRGNELHLWCVEAPDLGEYRANEARLGEIRARRAVLDRDLGASAAKVVSERRKLAEITVDLGRIEADGQAWVELTAQARRKANEAALNAIASVMLLRVDQIGNGKRELAAKQLDELYVEYQRSVLPTLAIRNAREARIVAPLRSWKTTQEFLRDLKGMTTVVSAEHSRSTGEEMRALAKLAAMAVNDPKAKVLLADVDFMISAVYANAASWTAQERVEQLLDLSDQGLAAVKSFAETHRKNVMRSRELKTELERLSREEDSLGKRQGFLRGED